MAKVHILKCQKPFFEATWYGFKKFEIRFDDRGYQVGDIIRLQEIIFDGGHIIYTGREINAKVSYIIQLNETPGIYNEAIDNAWVVMSIDVISNVQNDVLTTEFDDMIPIDSQSDVLKAMGLN